MNAVFSAVCWTEMSQRFSSYFGEGRVVSKQMLSSKAQDPFLRFRVWKPPSFELVSAA